jgi:hypothetical protein
VAVSAARRPVRSPGLPPAAAQLPPHHVAWVREEPPPGLPPDWRGSAPRRCWTTRGWAFRPWVPGWWPARSAACEAGVLRFATSLRTGWWRAVSPALGLRAPDRRAVRLRSWGRGWPGVPRRVELHYAPGIDDTDPLWLPAVVAAVSRRLLADYEVAGHDRRRCRLWLRRASPAPRVDPSPPAQVRAERTITELLGPTATITGIYWVDGNSARSPPGTRRRPSSPPPATATE